MTETAFLSAIIIAQFTVLAGMIMYIAQRLERRMDRLEERIDRLEERMVRMEARIDTRLDRLDERLRAVELRDARQSGRVLGDDPRTLEGLVAPPDVASAEAPAATT